jgi:hypothetical protein
MAPRKQKPVGEVAEEAVAQAEGEELGEELTQALSDIPTDAILRVERRDEESKIWAFCRRFGLDEFSIDKVQSLYGGGDYRVMAYYKSPKTQKQIMGRQRQFTIVGPPKWTAEVQTGAPPMNGDGQQRPSASSQRESIVDVTMLGLVKQMQDNSTMTLDMVRQNAMMQLEAMKAMSGPKIDVAALVTAAAAVLTPIVSALGNRQDPMEIAARMIELTRPKADTAAPAGFDGMLEILKTGMSLARGGNGEDVDPTAAMVNKGLDVVGKFAENLGRRNDAHPPAPMPSHPAPPAQTPTATNGAAPPAGAVRPWLAAVLPFKAQLAGLSRVLSAPAAVQEIGGRLDEQVVNDLLDDFELGTPEEFVARTMPVLDLPADKAAWLVEVVQGIAAEMTPEELPAGGPVAEVPKP